MLVLVIVLSLFAVAAACTIRFLWDQMYGKFNMLYLRLREQQEFLETFYFSGSDQFHLEPHQRNFVIKSISGESFRLTGYLWIGKEMADPFVSAFSDMWGEVVVSLFVGTGPATLYFEATPAINIVVSSTAKDQKRQPSVSIMPHFFQRGMFLKMFNWVARYVLKI